MDDFPPPPYTETDIYSHSGRSPASRPGSNDDDAATEVSSSRSTTIYTPPETPRESHYNFSGSDEHNTINSAQSYFETRPAQRRAPGQDLVVSLAVTDDSSPNSFPYPSWARERETTEQDWQTFLNYLLPDHAERANSHVLERKLRAEDDVESAKSERGIAEAQLGQIRSSSDLSTKSTHDIDAVIREWNDGFFGPRGVSVTRQTPLPSISSRSAADEHLPAGESQPQSIPVEQTARSRWNPFRPFEANNRGVRIGRLTVDGDRVAFGGSLEVDRNGVRWNGQSVDGSPAFGGPGAQRDMPGGPGPWFHQGRGGFGGHEMGRGRGGRWWKSGHDHHHHHGPRDRSPSSASSASSDSSDSDSSIGSLPDWDDLKDSQLPATKQSIAAWLAHPEQSVTKDMLKRARSDIKAAKNAPPPPANNAAWAIDKQALRQEVKALQARFKELKRQQRKANKALRKEKREQKRALKRERRDRRKAERKEHKTQERDFRRAERDVERNGCHGGPGAFNHFSGLTPPHIPSPPQPNLHVPPVPNIPAAPHVNVPPVPPVPGVPVHYPTAPLGFFGGPGGFLGGRGGFFGSGRGRAPWEAPVQAAQEQANLARAQAGTARAHAQEQANLARAQAGEARAHAQQQAGEARAHAQQQAGEARAHAQQQAGEARARAQQQAGWAQIGAQIGAQRAVEHARAQAAAAVAAWTGSSSRSHSHAHAHAQPQNPPSVPSPSPSPAPAPGSSKYAAADALEAQAASKTDRLQALQRVVEREQIEAAQRGEGDLKNKEKSEARTEMEALEAEIERLGSEVESLRLQADEELARNLEEEERLWERLERLRG
ncbi:hypothetical protein F4819DRAFT_479023 [Hypoxylon fuscum]|nr:hypothetical protein F4819DRAFT_479023 [Hypoxylon fuscum]